MTKTDSLLHYINLVRNELLKLQPSAVIAFSVLLKERRNGKCSTAYAFEPARLEEPGFLESYAKETATGLSASIGGRWEEFSVSAVLENWSEGEICLTTKLQCKCSV
jgi:hypothetical protein